MSTNQELFQSLKYVGGGMYRDSRVRVGETATVLHGMQMLDLAKLCMLEEQREGLTAAAALLRQGGMRMANTYTLAEEIETARDQP